MIVPPLSALLAHPARQLLCDLGPGPRTMPLHELQQGLILLGRPRPLDDGLPLALWREEEGRGGRVVLVGVVLGLCLVRGGRYECLERVLWGRVYLIVLLTLIRLL